MNIFVLELVTWYMVYMSIGEYMDIYVYVSSMQTNDYHEYIWIGKDIAISSKLAKH